MGPVHECECILFVCRCDNKLNKRKMEKQNLRKQIFNHLVVKNTAEFDGAEVLTDEWHKRDSAVKNVIVEYLHDSLLGRKLTSTRYFIHTG